MSELLPCPFCNESARIAPVGLSPVYWAQCNSCGAEGSESSSKEEAKRRWNCRSVIPASAQGAQEPDLLNGQPRAQYIWAMLKSYMLDECSLECASVSNADEKNLINLIMNSLPDDTRARNAALEEAAKIADYGCLVPPDGGSPTESEREMCEGIAAAIRLRKLAAPSELTEGQRAKLQPQKEQCVHCDEPACPGDGYCGVC